MKQYKITNYLEKRIFWPAAICSPFFAADMDFDYINELLEDECWLERVQGSDFLNQCSSDSSNVLNSPFGWSPSDTFYLRLVRPTKATNRGV